MKRGRLKSLDLPIRVDEISSEVQRTFDGELEWGLSVSERRRTASGHAFATGSAALRKEVEQDIARVGENDENVIIKPTTKQNHTTKFGEWIAIDDGWLIVSDEWVAGVVSRQLLGHPEDANLRLQGLLEEFDSPNVWQLGFAGRTVAEGGSKGVLYGKDVHEDPDLGEELRHTPLNELGVKHVHDGIPVKSYFAAGTGYLEVYDSEFTTRQFVDYVTLWVGDHVKGEDESSAESDADQEQEAADDSDTDAEQQTLEVEADQCENCDRESDTIKKTIVPQTDEVMELCVVCRDHVLETGEVPA
ncbi:hypothetical protein [Natrinema pallidum]|uniref:hypothetical protein n=1 Tax=Natrinema pallidum TaxID=69527 RepID=UPI003750C4D2